jgi:hypothetical protein
VPDLNISAFAVILVFEKLASVNVLILTSVLLPAALDTTFAGVVLDIIIPILPKIDVALSMLGLDIYHILRLDIKDHGK